MDARVSRPETEFGKPREAAARRTGIAGSLSLAILASCAVFAVLPAATYRTEAVVGIGDATTPLRNVLGEAAARAAVSKPVVDQAAASLIEAHLAVPTPSLLNKLFVAARLDAATGRDARLADALRDVVSAAPGDAPGIVRITADWPEAGGAARIATALAEAFVAHGETEAADLHARGQAEATRRLDALHANALSAHKRFTALGGTDLDPARTRAEAAAQVAAAQGRLDVVRAILGSGSPPISDRHDLPEQVGALQSAYLDQSQKLATARETYGERHTIVISLAESTKRAASALTTEWRRLGKVAEAELVSAQARETALRKPASSTDSAKQSAIEAARVEALAADDALARAERTRAEAPVDAHPARLLATAPVPAEATGLALLSRLLLSTLLGAGVFAAMRIRRRRPAVVSNADAELPEGTPRAEPRFFLEDEEAQRPARRAMPVAAPRAEPAPALVRRSAAAPSRPLSAPPQTVRAARSSTALHEILVALEPLVADAEMPTLLIATLGERRETTATALALAGVAAGEGLRVLVVEPEGASPTLAARADEVGPILIDLFGSLRVALPAKGYDGAVHVVPALRGGAEIAADLARDTDIALLGDLTAEFDLVIIDGGRTDDCADLAELSHGIVRIARHPSAREDEVFRARLQIDAQTYLGTLAGARFEPRSEPRAVPAVSNVHSLAEERARAQTRPAARPATQQRRRVSARVH